MQHTSLNSTMIISAGYENGVMEIEFNNGKRFQYAGVPQDVYDRLMRHSSPGSYFHQNIKGKYSAPGSMPPPIMNHSDDIDDTPL
jgi:hypothetical protein